MGLIKQVTQGDSYEESICELFQRSLVLDQSTPIQFNPAISPPLATHYLSVSSGEISAVQATTKDIEQESNCLRDEQPTRAQPTPLPSKYSSTTPVSGSFTIFELPQISATLRAANNYPDHASKSLLGVIIDPGLIRNLHNTIRKLTETHIGNSYQHGRYQHHCSQECCFHSDQSYPAYNLFYTWRYQEGQLHPYWPYCCCPA